MGRAGGMGDELRERSPGCQWRVNTGDYWGGVWDSARDPSAKYYIHLPDPLWQPGEGGTLPSAPPGPAMLGEQLAGKTPPGVLHPLLLMHPPPHLLHPRATASLFLHRQYYYTSNLCTPPGKCTPNPNYCTPLIIAHPKSLHVSQSLHPLHLLHTPRYSTPRRSCPSAPRLLPPAPGGRQGRHSPQRVQVPLLKESEVEAVHGERCQRRRAATTQRPGRILTAPRAGRGRGAPRAPPPAPLRTRAGGDGPSTTTFPP